MHSTEIIKTIEAKYLKQYRVRVRLTVKLPGRVMVRINFQLELGLRSYSHVGLGIRSNSQVGLGLRSNYQVVLEKFR